jgi:hypothetical protein
MDERKSEDGDLRKFGDFFLWKELLEHGKEQKRPLIFVTDDQKEDWWLKVKGRTLGPRPELIAEFREHSGQMFHMYLPDRFLEWVSKQRGEEVKPAAISEVRELQFTSSASIISLDLFAHHNETRCAFQSQSLKRNSLTA